MSDLTNEEACFWEKFFIFLFRSNNPIYGYNGTSGGEGSPDKKISAESRRKMSVAQKKRFENPEKKFLCVIKVTRLGVGNIILMKVNRK